MKSHQLQYLLFVLSTFFVNIYCQIQVIQPTGDTFLIGGTYSNSEYGSQANLLIKYGTSPESNKISLLSFNIQPYFFNQTQLDLEDASIKLWMDFYGSTLSSLNFDVSIAVMDWDEENMNYDNFLSIGSAANQTVGRFYITKDTTSIRIPFTVENIVWINEQLSIHPTGFNLTWILTRNNNQADQISFKSKEGGSGTVPTLSLIWASEEKPVDSEPIADNNSPAPKKDSNNTNLIIIVVCASVGGCLAVTIVSAIATFILVKRFRNSPQHGAEILASASNTGSEASTRKNSDYSSSDSSTQYSQPAQPPPAPFRKLSHPTAKQTPGSIYGNSSPCVHAPVESSNYGSMEGNPSSDIQLSPIMRSRFTSTVDYKDIVFGEELGSGAYATVYLAKWRGLEVAVKYTSHQDDLTPQQMKDFCAELQVMRSLAPHKNVVKLIGFVTDPCLCTLMQYCPQGSLYNYIHDPAQPLTTRMCIELIKGIVLGLMHLHKANIVHRDLAARNILLDENFDPLISDFGYSRFLEFDNQCGRKTRNDVGPLKWMAVESLVSNVYSKKSDIWSLGVLVWEIFTREEPFPQMQPVNAAIAVREGTRLPIPDYCPSPLAGVLAKCWSQQPQERPELSEILGVVLKLEQSKFEDDE